MTVPITTLRSTLAAALESAGDYSVFSFPPSTPIANSVIIQPDDPYIEPSNQNYAIAPKVNFKIVLIVPLFDNQGNLNGIEDLLTKVFNKLSSQTAIKLAVGVINSPNVLSGVAGEMLTAEMSVSIMSSWS